MRRMKVVGLVGILALWASGATAVTIDFDSFVNDNVGNGEITGLEYAGLGIIFSTTDLALNLGTTPGGLSQPNSLGADKSVVNDFDGSVVLEFTGNQFATDLTFYAFNPLFQATAYNVAGDPVHTIIGTPNPFTQFMDFTGFEVHRVVVTGDFYAIDDVSFGELQNPVPEPGTLLLLGGGLLGLARRRRRPRA